MNLAIIGSNPMLWLQSILFYLLSYMEELLYNEKLKPSRPDTVSREILNELQWVKQRIEAQKEDWYIVAIVHLSWDLTHSAHIAYMNTIHKKLRKEVWKPFKLVVWVEADVRTEERKNKKNVFSEDERRYIFENLKVVDKAYIEFEWIEEQNNNFRPAWIIQFLEPNVMVSHEEHIPREEQEQVRNRVKERWWELIVVNFEDQEKFGIPDMRMLHERSTTNTIKSILQLYKDHPKYV